MPFNQRLIITLTIKADSVEEKTEWVTEIWDLFFSHMLKLRGENQSVFICLISAPPPPLSFLPSSLPPSSDDNLQSHGTQAISNLITTGTATLTRGRPLTHSMRRARIATISHNRQNREARATISGPTRARPTSTASISSIGSATSLQEFTSFMKQNRDRMNFSPSPYSPSSPQSSFMFSDAKPKQLTRLSQASAPIGTVSSSSSISSISTLGSIEQSNGFDPENTLIAASNALATSNTSLEGSEKPMFTTPI